MQPFKTPNIRGNSNEDKRFYLDFYFSEHRLLRTKYYLSEEHIKKPFSTEGCGNTSIADKIIFFLSMALLESNTQRDLLEIYIVNSRFLPFSRPPPSTTLHPAKNENFLPNS